MFAFARFIGALVIEKAVCWPFYWVYFPLTIKEHGIKMGVLKLYIIQVVCSVVIWAGYDLIGRDLIGINTVKAKCLVLVGKIRALIGRSDKEENTDGKEMSKTAWIVEYVLCSWQLMPPLALLCVRRDGKKGKVWKELILLSTSAAIATAFWTILSKIVLSGLK